MDGQMADLVRLRNEAEALKQQINALGEAGDTNPSGAAITGRLEADPHPPEYYQELHQMAGGKDKDAITLGLRLRMYAIDHQKHSLRAWIKSRLICAKSACR